MAFYDKDKIKNALQVNDIFKLLEYYKADPVHTPFGLIAHTVCHNGMGDGSDKLYYYENSGFFNCYTGCSSMDIYELVQRVHSIEENEELTFYQTMDFVAKFFKLEGVEGDVQTYERSEESIEMILNNYKTLTTEEEKVKIEYKIYDRQVLDKLPFLPPIDWVNEGIGLEAMKKYEIKYYGPEHKIVIPHYNITSDLIGIRSRTLSELDAELYGKYMPIRIGGIMYSHPLSYNLYGLNFNIDNINKAKRMIIFEGE